MAGRNRHLINPRRSTVVLESADWTRIRVIGRITNRPFGGVITELLDFYESNHPDGKLAKSLVNLVKEELQ